MTDRAGVVGFGRVGRNHAEAFLADDDFELGAIADPDTRLLAEMGDLWDVPETHRYRDHAAMLAAEDLDVVSVATPGRLHRDHVLDAVGSAADPDVIWCEKPIATTVRDAERMVTACERASVELVVDHSRTFSAAFRTLRELLHDRELLGDLRSARIVSGGELLNVGTHWVDLLLFLLDARVSDVRGGRVEPLDSHGEIRFEGGGTLLMDDGTVAYLDAVPGSETRLYLEGTDGRLSAPLSIARDADREWQYWRVDHGGRTQTDPPEPLTSLWREDNDGVHGTFEPGMVPAQPLFENAVAHLGDLLVGRAENAAPGTRAVHGLEALVGMLLSEYTGSRVSLPLAEPFRGLPLAFEV